MPPASDRPVRSEWLAYVRVRGIPRTFLGWLTLQLLTVFGATTLYLPSWPGTAPPVKAYLLIPVLSGLWTVGTLRSTMADLERVAARRLRYWNTVHVCMALVLQAVPLFLITGHVAGHTAAVTAVRNALLWTGIGLALIRLIGHHRVWLALPGMALLTAVLGWQGDSAAQPWALPWHSGDHVIAAVVTVAAFSLGLVSSMAPSRRCT